MHLEVQGIIMKQSKLQIFGLILGIISSLLAIVEFIIKPEVFSFLYPLFSQNSLIAFFGVFGAVLITAYIITVLFNLRSKSGFFFMSDTLGSKPLYATPFNRIIGDVFGVRWYFYKPDVLNRRRGVWVEGPYCPECERELETEVRGKLRKKEVWYCPSCEKDYLKPDGNAKKMALKDFEAILRKRGEL
jgi:ribosomal protein L37AE/L43A